MGKKRRVALATASRWSRLMASRLESSGFQDDRDQTSASRSRSWGRACFGAGYWHITIGVVVSFQHSFWCYEIRRFRLHPTRQGNALVCPCIPSVQGGVMEPSKKRPTRGDLVAAWKTIRDQYQIIKLQAEKIRRLAQAVRDVLRADPRPAEFYVN
jgi:hypothetical protein